MITSKTIFFTLWLLSTPLAFAGNGHVIGNGGSTLRCEINGQVTYEAYDLAEGELVWDMIPQFSAKTHYLDKAREIVERLAPLSPGRVKRYIDWINNFEANTHFLPAGRPLETIHDNSLVVIPDGCELKQTISQINLGYPNVVTYVIDGEIWKLLDENQKAALVVHEIIYHEGLMQLNSHENSVAIRHFNQTLHANLFKGMTARKFINFLAEHEFDRTDIQGVNVRLYFYDETQQLKKGIPLDYYSDGSVRSASLPRNDNFEFSKWQISYYCDKEPAGYKYNVKFYPGAKLKSLTLPEGCFGNYLDLVTFAVLPFNQLEFTEDGNLNTVQ